MKNSFLNTRTPRRPMASFLSLKFTAKMLSSFGVLTVTFSLAQALPPGSTKNFQSPNGTVESCIAIEKVPGGKFSKKDIEREESLCAINIYNPIIGLCPKTWSTSPGTIFHDLRRESRKAGTEHIPHAGVADFERTYCTSPDPKDQTKKLRYADAFGKLAKFKTTMSAPTTSATYSISSLVYYHLSRYFDSEVEVPVAVFRTIDARAHYNRVASVARPSPSARMNYAAWEILKAAELNPKTYNPTSDLFTPDLQQIYGVVLKSGGERYGYEINGIRSAWGKPQNVDFQNTPGFLALRIKAPLLEAIQSAIPLARQTPKLDSAMPTDPPVEQMAYWAQELSEIALFDYIMSQQDRVGNIDFEAVWTWMEEGKIKTKKQNFALPRKLEPTPRVVLNQFSPPADIARFKPVLLQRTILGDNDAGGKIQYANFTKSTGMLENFRHLHAKTYTRLITLAKDMRAKGALYEHFKSKMGLGTSEFNQFQKNVVAAADILKKSCQAGQLIFDLDADQLFKTGQVLPVTLDCQNPTFVDDQDLETVSNITVTPALPSGAPFEPGPQSP